MTATPATPASAQAPAAAAVQARQPDPAAAPSGPRRRRLRPRKKVSSWLLLTGMVVVAVVMLYPFWYMIDNAFRSGNQFDRQNGHSLAGWRALFANLPVGSQMLNSALVCAAAIAIILVVSTTAGFAFAKLRYRGSGTIFLLVVSALMVPLQSIIIPEYVNLARLNLTTSYTGAVLVY